MTLRGRRARRTIASMLRPAAIVCLLLVVAVGCTTEPGSGTVPPEDGGFDAGAEGDAEGGAETAPATDAGSDAPSNTTLPGVLTFHLRNDRSAAVYIYIACGPDLAIHELTTPPKAIGLPEGCPICDCAATTCSSPTCGPCAYMPFEIVAGSTQPLSWLPVDITRGMRGMVACSHRRVLPPGVYRIDLPVYDRREDAATRSNPRVVSVTFALPTTEPVVLPL